MKKAESLRPPGERFMPDQLASSEQVRLHISRYIFAKGFIKDKSILELGCGIGYGSNYLKSSGAKEVVAGDISEDAIKYAR
jgi:2-polyprenyl-3-methyl-5-hydroxy-6-metoxy-1,4-benzoquinol methylase